MKKFVLPLSLTLALVGCFLVPVEPDPPPAPSAAKDPGVRGGSAGVGDPIAGLTDPERAAFYAGLKEFNEEDDVKDGLGPTMNLDSCKGCHVQPALGGTSPAVNPQVDFATKMNARNTVPSFLTRNGPVREVRFVKNHDRNRSPDGGVHALFTIAGRSDAAGCVLIQPDVEAEFAQGNVIFRIPTPTFGAGLIEHILDDEILQQLNNHPDKAKKDTLGIRGKPNIVLPFHAVSGQPNKNGNDGTLGRFGWKAQNKSLLIFSGEAYNVEMGITNEAFPTERDETPACQFKPIPNNVTNLGAQTLLEGLSSIEKFASFMRFLAPPQTSPDTPGGAESIARGKSLFGSIGCAFCHTPTLRTGEATVAALRNQPVDLYSDLLLHDMGVGLADGVAQGQATGNEFRTAPLWGLGQRLFFLHDGRTADVRVAILAHHSNGSEANKVLRQFDLLREDQKQDVLNFLRSL
jgi:CxxC motif-containing protein (DUF1111 family)